MRLARPAALALACALLCAGAQAGASGERFYQTKTPYQPQQEMARYQPVPAGYHAVQTQMLARHGARGLTGFKTDLALYNLWLQASQEGALTPLGAALGPDLRQLMRANFLLGYGVPGISKPGYGNETMQGIQEHTALAQRMQQRLPELFRDAAASAAQQPRRITVVTSGKDRAVDSGAFFVQALLARQAGLAPLLDYPPARAPQAASADGKRPAGTDRYQLYFHQLNAKQDKGSDPADPLYRTYMDSQAYQAYASSADLHTKEGEILNQPRLAEAAQVVLARLFTPAFVASFSQGRRSTNSGTYSYTSNDGKLVQTLTGDGHTVIDNPTSAALALYELYCAAADMQGEGVADFGRYLPSAQAAVFAETDDAISFYRKGPASAGSGGVTYRMAQLLLDDFFNTADAAARGDLSQAAKLRFAHAETVVPFAALLGLRGMSESLPDDVTYRYDNSPWRGETVAPMAANVQWDVYRNADGNTLVRMLYNEKETAFKPACDSARIGSDSFYYDYGRLRACYRNQP
ncbi:histidine-type phosphatase [Duganella sp. FT3S]|uniref:Multiple inositol polyphosphate phosphatase 1 n=2 Tax=Rugamonas fusca TaxID=2758568 RepID=A0A7W2I5R1_9BURK|nr:histidine-type phosphatase [Rugamonas fusca]